MAFSIFFLIKPAFSKVIKCSDRRILKYFLTRIEMKKVSRFCEICALVQVRSHVKFELTSS